MRIIERGGLGLDDPVSLHIPPWRDHDTRFPITIRDLLAHCSGLPAHLPLFREHAGRIAFEQAICNTPLAYQPRSASVYSDIGFMLLGFILEDIAPLPIQFDTLVRQMGGIQDLQFLPPKAWRSKVAPTREDEWRGRLLIGEVDDNNAWALGGAAGHAGLFGTAQSVGECARHLLQGTGWQTGRISGADATFFRQQARRYPHQFARARLGHDAAHVVVWHTHVAARVRARRVHGNVSVDRSRFSDLRCPVDEPRSSQARQRCNQADTARVA